MSNTLYTASQLNAWMHEYHQDTVAELGQLGLAVEFIDAQAGRPTSLRLSSEKATFGFHLPVPAHVHGVDASIQAVADMVSKTRQAAQGFQQAYDASESTRSPLDISAVLQDSQRWQLHATPPEAWLDRTRYGPWKPAKMDKAIGTVADLVARWAVEQNALRQVKECTDHGALVRDAARSTYNPDAPIPEGLPASSCAFDIVPMGAECTRYRVWLSGVFTEEGHPLVALRTQVLEREALAQGRDRFLPAGEANFCISQRAELYMFSVGASYENTTEQGCLDAEDLGMTNETLAMLITLETPVALGMPDFQQPVESYSFDFSMDDQATTSGLSL